MKKLIILSLAFSLTQCTKEKDGSCIEVPHVSACFQYDPVCGCNGKTYSSVCEAEVNEIKHYTKGACR